LNKVLRDNAADLLSHDEVQQLLDKLATKSPKLVEDLVPGKLSLGVVTRTLQNLLERVGFDPRHALDCRDLVRSGQPNARTRSTDGLASAPSWAA
jgi:flagellar biosynthesis protein FlhA